MLSKRVKHLKKDDLVVSLSGDHKGKFGKVLEVCQASSAIKVEGIGIVKRHTKPTQGNPKGGIVEKNRWIPASKFQVCSETGKALGRVSFKIEGTEKKKIFSKTKKSA